MRAPRFLLLTLPIFAALAATLAYGTLQMVHARLLAWGEQLYPGYALLKQSPDKPTCKPEDFVVPQPGAQGGGGDDLLDGLGDDAPAPAASAEAVLAAKKRCEEAHAAWARSEAQKTPSFVRFEVAESAVAAAVEFGSGHLQQLLVVVLLLSAAAATASRSHISIRGLVTQRDAQVAEVVQLGANFVFLTAQAFLYRVDVRSGITQGPQLQLWWVAGLAILVAMNAWNLSHPPSTLKPGGSIAPALLCAPLYAVMGLIAGAWFFLKERYPSGLAVQLGLLTEHSLLYLQVGLYVWIGMLLKRTRVATLMLDSVRPFSLPPPVLAFVVVAAAAIPTAYSGASGIFVMAAGAVVYAELRRGGASRQLALASTSMSGSLGVVLRPCLLVVIVASLNKQVTTDELYHWGTRLYALSAFLFLVFALLLDRTSRRGAPRFSRVALDESANALRALLPYAVLALAIILFYEVLLRTPVNEHTAPSVLPVVMLALVGLEAWLSRRHDPSRPRFFSQAMGATDETAGQVGALLLLMAASVGLGAIVERGGLMDAFPHAFASPVMAMVFLVGVLVVVGMTMDPYGAVILISATFSSVAYASHIHPVHFWMVVLVAFELGYLTPPVALNQLLARHVVGEDEWAAARAEGQGFLARNLGTILPVAVMGTALLLAAFVPLAFY